MIWGKYNLINTEDLINKLDAYLMTDDKPNFPVIAYDTETTGLRLYKTSIIGFSLSVNASQGFYIPLLEWIPDLNSKKQRTKDGVKLEVFTDGHFVNVWTGKVHPENVLPQDVDYPEWVPHILKRWFGQSHLFMWNAPFDINHTFICFGVDLKEQLAIDGGLIAHILNENESVGLKENAILYQAQLGINPWVMADAEKRELKGSILRNGGKANDVWRADLIPQMTYAAADTFLTYGLINVMLAELEKERKEQYPKIDKWIFDEEVMPVCKEVVVDMKRQGVHIDVEHFKKLYEQNAAKLISLEDEFNKAIAPYMANFTLGKSVDEAVSHQRLVKKIIELEGLKIPTVTDKKTGEVKESIAKAVVKKTYEENPHWIWGYLLDQDEIKYSETKLNQIKQELYAEVIGRRYRFNLNSSDHLSWLFFDILKENKYLFPKTEKSTEEEWTPSLEGDSIKHILLPKYEWVGHLLKFKKILKMQSTYIEPALELNIDGWMYMDMKQNGTTSGRFSCSGGYNLQTLPRVEDELEALNECPHCDAKRFNKDGSETGLVIVDQYIECMANRICKNCGKTEYDIPCPSAIKKGFTAPKGYKIVNADYSSLEPRAFAFMSNEDKIKAVYKQGLDLYSKVYCDIFDKEGQYSADPKAPNFLKKANPKMRKFIKPICLGVPYGSMDAQVASMIGATIKSDKPNKHGVYEERPDIQKGKEVRDAYLNTYPKLKEYMDQQEYMACTYGFAESIYGRRRHFEYAKVISDYFMSICKYDIERMDIVNSFVKVSRKNLTGANAQIKHESTGNIILTLSKEHLEKIAELLKMTYSFDKYGKDGIIQKGGWAYIRGLLKADLNNTKNHPIQALAGHIANMGMITTTRLFKENQIDGYLCNQVHDELMCYVREDQAELGKQLLQKGMEENIFTLPIRDEVEMIAEPTICDNLKDSK